jgi:hypothetical protein
VSQNEIMKTVKTLPTLFASYMYLHIPVLFGDKTPAVWQCSTRALESIDLMVFYVCGTDWTMRVTKCMCFLV